MKGHRNTFQWLGAWTDSLFLSIRARIIIGYLIVAALGFSFLSWKLTSDVRPRYLEAEEEIMVDMANILAAFAEGAWNEETLHPVSFEEAFQKALRRSFEAKIYSITKRSIDLHVVITNASGIVLFDSDGGDDVGKDFSQWNDIYLTLKGDYGARSTRRVKHDPSTSILHVAAPIYRDGKVVGALSVSKPLTIMATLMNRTEQRIILYGIIAAAGVSLIGGLLAAWITYPIANLTAYAKAIRDGEPVAFPVLGHSEIRTLGLAFEQMRDALEGKDYVNRYIQTLTHEIKSPLAAIRGAAELLHEEMPLHDRERFLANIQAETLRIQEAIDSLLLLAAVETKKALDDAAPFSWKDLLDAALHRLENRASLKNITFQRQLPPKEALSGYGDFFLLERTVVNLLENAIAFSPSGGVISLSLIRSNAHWRLRIEDEGPGLPDYAIDKVFDRFYSLPRPDTGKKSSGLGLAFVHEVVILHRGMVTLGNREPKGLWVELELPN